MTSARVVVAGAGGFLGSHIVRLIHQNADDVVALVRPGGESHRLNEIQDLKVIETDITSKQAVDQALQDVSPTHVINAAAYGVRPDEQDFPTAVAVNVMGVFNLLSAASNAGAYRFVQIGSYFEYGDYGGPLTEETPLRPASTYAATKVAGSLLTHDKRLCGSMEAIVARPFQLWGPEEDKHRLVPQVIRACSTKSPLDMTQGSQTKDFVFVIDAARWIAELTLKGGALPHRTFNIAGHINMTVRDFAEAIAQKLSGLEYLRFSALPLPSREPLNGSADTTRLQAILPHTSSTPFDEALQSTIKSFTAP